MLYGAGGITMFHMMWIELKLWKKEINEIQGEKLKIQIFLFLKNGYLKIFTIENMKEVLRKSTVTGKKFEEYMPNKYKDYLKSYLEGMKKDLYINFSPPS